MQEKGAYLTKYSITLHNILYPKILSELTFANVWVLVHHMKPCLLYYPDTSLKYLPKFYLAFQ